MGQNIFSTVELKIGRNTLWISFFCVLYQLKNAFITTA